MSIHIISGAKQSGKTAALIGIAHTTGSYIVVRNQETATQVFHRAMEMGLSINFPITWEELRRGQYHGQGVKSFAIDDLDQFVQHIAGGPPVIAATLPELEDT